MAGNNSKPVARRLHKGRVGGCLLVLVFIFIIMSTLISGCTKKHQKEKQKTDPASSVSVQTETVTQPVQEVVKRDYIICIDPGHGGDDIGSSNGDRLEKVDNLRYATAVYEELQKREGIQVLITRQSNDTYMTNAERAEYANRAGADLYLALHRNQLEDHTANGVEIWIQKEATVVDEVLGFKLMEALKSVGIQNDRGVHPGYTNDTQNNFQIIEYTNMPACIVELGFLSNDDDNALFDAHYRDYAKAIADVVTEMCRDGYLDKVEKSE